MKRLLTVLLAILLVAAVSVPTASAWDRDWHGRGGWGERHEFHGGGGFFPGYAFGAVTGLILGGALARPYYAPPAPVYVVPPPPVCYTQPGYWSQVPYSDGYYGRYQPVWVPPRTSCGWRRHWEDDD